MVGETAWILSYATWQAGAKASHILMNSWSVNESTSRPTTLTTISLKMSWLVILLTSIAATGGGGAGLGEERELDSFRQPKVPSRFGELEDAARDAAGLANISGTGRLAKRLSVEGDSIVPPNKGFNKGCWNLGS